MPPFEKQYPDFRLPAQGGNRQPSPIDQAAARKKSLGVLAVVLILLMAIIATAGLDNLPRRLHDEVSAAQSRLNNDKSQMARQRAYVEQALKDEPDLFRSQEQAWRGRLDAGQGKLSGAETQLAALVALAKANRRSDADRVEQGLRQLQSDEAAALKDAEALRNEAARWVGYKRDLPARLAAMAGAHSAIAAFDAGAAAPVATKAMADWPAKKPDLEARLAALAALKGEAEGVWNGSAGERAKASQPKPEGLDYGALFQAGERLDQIQGQLRDGAGAVNAMAAQLYDSWDKLLLEVNPDEGRERVRVVRTHFADASLRDGKVSQEEKWEPMDTNGGRQQRERNAGLVVARKPAGKYDSEAERVAEAPAYAYIAPPGQSNSYGSWNNGVWQWLPQYLILRELLQPRYNGPIRQGDWQAYDYARRRGDTWYGPDDAFNRSRNRWSWSSRGSSPYTGQSGGGFYRERSSKPTFGDRSYSGSKYRSQGSFSGSKYQSRGSFGSRSYSRGSFGGGRGRR